MDEIFVLGIIEVIFNFIGACIRWVYGTIWRTMAHKPKFTFKEYLNGPKKSSDFFDEFSHGTNNVIIGVVFFFIATAIIVKFSI